MSQSITEKIADFFQGLAHPTRIEILELLKNKDQMCVCEIVEKLKKDQSNISRHLNALKRVGILEFRGEGTRSFYKIKSEEIYKTLDTVKSILRKELKEGQKILAAF